MQAAWPLVYFTATLTPETSPAQSSSAKQVITLSPTPILMVHGLWGSSEDWAALDFSLQLIGPPLSDALVTSRADYFQNHSKSFAANMYVIPKESALLINKCRHEQNYAATRVDVVAHSMGGILTRIATTVKDYRNQANFNAGYIRRVITVDVPHYGGISAPFLFRYLDAFTDDGDFTHRLFWMTINSKDPYAGAVQGCDPNTFAKSVGGVSGLACMSMSVPAHAIACEASQFGDVDFLWETFLAWTWRDDFLDDELIQRNPKLGTLSKRYIATYDLYNSDKMTPKDPPDVVNLWHGEFIGQANDGTVAAPSQLGGCVKSTTVSAVSHVTAPHDEKVISRIVELLNGTVEDNFSLSSLPEVTQADIDTQKAWSPARSNAVPGRPTPRPRGGDAAELSFNSALTSTNAQRGSPVYFQLGVPDPDNWSRVIVGLLAEGTVVAAMQVTNSELSGSFICPSNLLGAATLVAAGRYTNGNVSGTSVEVTVQPPSGVTLLAMATESSSVVLDALSASRRVRVRGTFSDMVERQMGNVGAGTHFIVENTNIAVVDQQGRVTACGEGVTWLDVVNGVLSNRISVQVVFQPPEILAVLPSMVSSNVRSNVLLSIAGLRFGGADNIEVRRDAAIARGISISRMTPGQSEGLITAEVAFDDTVQAGSYSIVVTTPGGRSDVSESKGAQLTIVSPLGLEISALANGRVGSRVNGGSGDGFVVETSADLQTWRNMLTNALVGGRWETNGILVDSVSNWFFRVRAGE